MNCLPCFGSKNSDSKEKEELPVAQAKEIPNSQAPVNNVGRPSSAAEANHQQQQENSAAAAAAANANEVVNNSNAHTFTFRELLSATKNFRQECLLGESGFGKVYRGTLQATGQVVAVKQLDRHGTKANKEFLVEVMMLSLLHHPNLVDLIGYCADGEQRLLVYEYMRKGSLKDHLLETKPDTKPLDWLTRMKIASGTAQAVEYLHDKANPPVIYRNLKSSNILLDENFEPKLTDYGLVKLELDSGNNHQRMVNINGCCAPEYERNGELTPKSDVYSFGVILLELITGRRALDTSLPNDQQNLVTWAQPYFRDPKRFPELADPKMNGAFPERSLNQAVGVAAMCLQEEPFVRPLIADVVAALSFLTVPLTEGSSTSPTAAVPASPQKTSSSSSESEKEPAAKEKLEAAPRRKDQKEGSSSDDEDAESDSESHDQSGKFNEDGGSSSESLYNEDDYSDAESEQEDTGNVSMRRNSRAKSRAKSRASSKRKVMFEIDNDGTSRNSSKQSGKSFKTHSNSKGSSVSRKSSRRDGKKIKSNSSKKSKGESDDDPSSTDSDNKSSRRNHSSRMGKSESRGYSESDLESDESASHRRSFSSTSKLSLDSRGSSNC